MKRKFGAILFLSSVLFVSGCVGQAARESDASNSAPDDAAKMFTLKDIRGNNVSLENLLKEKKAVLVNFWATWCPPCREEIPGLMELQKNFEDKGFTVLGVDAGESQTKVSSFAKKMGMNYPLVLDSSQGVAESYGIVGIPTSFLMNSDGKIVGEYHSYSKKLIRDVEKAVR